MASASERPIILAPIAAQHRWCRTAPPPAAAAAAATGKGKRKRKRGRAAATARAAVHLPGSADELLDRPGGLAPVTIVSCERLGCRASRDHHCLADRPRLSLRAAELPLRGVLADDLLTKLHERRRQLLSVVRVVICDESHALKNRQARRTQALTAVAADTARTPRLLMLSGALARHAFAASCAVSLCV